MSNALGILGAIALALLGGNVKFGKPESGPIGYPWREPQGSLPVTPAAPAPAPAPTEQFGMPPSLANILPTTAPTSLTAPAVATSATPAAASAVFVVSSPLPRAPSTITPSAAPAPSNEPIKTGWNWFTPQGPITSRNPTPEEEESGQGCPEVPGIWDYSSRSPSSWRYCANPECPSNKTELDPQTGQYLPATPAVLNQEVDSAGNITYFCQVCRTYQ